MKKDHPQKPAKNVDEYLAAVPDEVRPVLEKLRKAIRSAAPKAEEGISFQIPMFKYHGPLVFFAAFRNHCSFYVVSKPIMEVFTSELKPWDTSGTTIHFPAKNPLPASLVKKIVKARIEENEARVKNRTVTIISAQGKEGLVATIDR
ncbi:MAG TPA: DUF1801 domain-containing protein [Methanoregula sp.]|nr:DUF1801 domain-containing protein [Methanoregula sp.]